MKSNFDILNTLFKVLNVTNITNQISGKICKIKPYKNSQNEDIIINVLTNPNGYIQNGFANINIYVPDDENGINTKRLKELIDIVTPLIDNVIYDDFRFQIYSQLGPFVDSEFKRDNLHFINIKLNYQTA